MIEIGTVFEGALVETCKDSQATRPRVRAIHEEIPSEWRVTFPRKLREDYPMGSRFRCTLKVCQKHNNDGSVKGRPYLDAATKTIVPITDFIPDRVIYAILNPNSKDGRSHLYIDPADLHGGDFMQIRASLLSNTEESTAVRESIRIERPRSDKVKAYVHIRANGVCECCGDPAPFISKNDQPYLEIHHIQELSKGGEDSPNNTAAICPNCHTEITHGVNGLNINQQLRESIATKELELDRNRAI